MTSVNDILGFLGLPPDPDDVEVARPAPLDAAGADAVTFCNRAPRPVPAALVLAEQDGDYGAARVAIVPNARLAFIRVVRRFFPPPGPPAGIHPSAIVDEEATLGSGVRVGAGCTVARDVEVGEDTALLPGVHLLPGTRIGRNCEIGAGTVIGGDGFGYERDERDRWVAFPHLRGVVIGDDVRIGGNCAVDRGPLKDTVIESGVKLDNLIHVAHGVHIKRDAAAAAMVMLSGSVTVGERVWIAPSVVVRDGLTVGDDAFLGVGAVVVRDVEAGAVVMGNPARPRESR